MYNLEMTLEQIADVVGGEVLGDKNIVIKGVSGIKEAQEGDITFLANQKYYPLVEKTEATAIIVERKIRNCSKPAILTDNPSLAFAKVVNLIAPASRKPQGISNLAFIGEGVKLGKNVAIGPFVILEDDVEIGEDTIIYGGCYIGFGTKIGKKCLLYSHVSIRERITVGNNVIIHSGTVIGSDGFGFAEVEGVQYKIPQIGTVVIEDDVEIGANVTIDRARFDKTVIGRGTKIDNLVQIAHNVIVGKNCLIVAQAGISGSTLIGDNVIIAGQAGLVGHIEVGEGAVIMAKSGVPKSVPKNTRVFGYPAKEEKHAKRVNAIVQRLPEIYQELKELKRKVKEIEVKLT